MASNSKSLEELVAVVVVLSGIGMGETGTDGSCSLGFVVVSGIGTGEASTGGSYILGFLISRSALAVAAKVSFCSGILRFLTPGLAGPTRAGRLAGKDGPSACSSQNMHGS